MSLDSTSSSLEVLLLSIAQWTAWQSKISMGKNCCDQTRARKIIERYRDTDFSYCDAISFVVMERLGISEVMAFDEHFRQYGKLTLL